MTQKKKPDKQLSFGDEVFIYPEPAPQAQAPRRKAAPAKKAARATAPAAAQAFLPGLSRRGRPRVKNPLPPTVRASESRKRRLASGGKRLELMLPAETAAQLEALVRHYKGTRAEVVARLIARAAKRLPED